MDKLKALARHIPFLDAIISLGSAAGLWAILWAAVAILWAGGVTAWAWLSSETPPWGLALIFTVTAAVVMIMIAKATESWRNYVVAKAASNFDAQNYTKLGTEIISLTDEMKRFISDRQRDAMMTSQKERPTDGDDLAVSAYERGQWFQDQQYERMTEILAKEKFGTRAVTYLALLKTIGVEMPPHIGHGLGNSRSIGFLSIMGGLLAAGNIKEAIDISYDRNFIWSAV